MFVLQVAKSYISHKNGHIMKRPNINLDTKPQIIVDMPQVLEAFCRHIFFTLPDQKQIIVKRTHPVGQLIYSKFSVSHTPVKASFRSNPVTLILPVNNKTHWRLNNHFLYVDNLAQEQIVTEIDYQFNKWVQKRFERGYELKYDQKTIIEAILRGLNLRNNAANFDAIKKNDYRNRRKAEEKRFAELLKICECVD